MAERRPVKEADYEAAADRSAAARRRGGRRRARGSSPSSPARTRNAVTGIEPVHDGWLVTVEWSKTAGPFLDRPARDVSDRAGP